MAATLRLAEMSVEVARKPIRNLHLGVYPPDGRVRIAAPERMPIDAIRLFAISKLSWIRRQQARFVAQERAFQPEYVERESHYDLVFANSAGSKASLGLSPDNFKTMHQLARGFTPLDSNLSKCKDASMQMHVVAAGKPERTITMCVNAKNAEADRLRGLSQSLAAMVR